MVPSGEPTRVIFSNIAYGWLVYIFAVAMAVAFGGVATGITACGDKANNLSAGSPLGPRQGSLWAWLWPSTLD
jgi:hypothetical protein